jgi:tRNA(adenine34) deaminase
LASETLSQGFLEAQEGPEDEKYMKMALQEAVEALQEGEVPVGAVLVMGGRVLATAHNRCEKLRDPTAHAEMLALREACSRVKNYRLLGGSLYVTVEPCLMCAGALHLARLERVVYGCADPKAGAMGSRYSIHSDGKLNHTLEVRSGVLETECSLLMSSFFRQLRERPKKFMDTERWPSLA